MNVDANQLITGIVTIIVAVVGSQWFGTWVNSRNSNGIRAIVDQLKKDIERMKATEEEREIMNSRRRILRFNDELLNNVDHSKEYFDDVVNDCTIYKNYCAKNPSFRNGKAVLAIENIERVYRICMEEHKFL